MTKFEKYENLSFEKFKELASDKSLCKSEKIGFPPEYREHLTPVLMSEIEKKIPAYSTPGARILDIGIGCGDLAYEIINRSRSLRHDLVIVDSREVIENLPAEKGFTSVSGKFPDVMRNQPEIFNKPFDGIICYSVIHYAFITACIFSFFDSILSLLNSKGHALLGDIPNISMRNRFLNSAEGVQYHKKYMKTDQPPAVKHLTPVAGEIDDAVIVSLVLRGRSAGCNVFLMPQNIELPMENRREDIVIHKP